MVLRVDGVNQSGGLTPLESEVGGAERAPWSRSDLLAFRGARRSGLLGDRTRFILRNIYFLRQRGSAAWSSAIFGSSSGTGAQPCPFSQTKSNLAAG
jgi:hypothetical protein